MKSTQNSSSKGPQNQDRALLPVFGRIAGTIGEGVQDSFTSLFLTVSQCLLATNLKLKLHLTAHAPQIDCCLFKFVLIDMARHVPAPKLGPSFLYIKRLLLLTFSPQTPSNNNNFFFLFLPFPTLAHHTILQDKLSVSSHSARESLAAPPSSQPVSLNFTFSTWDTSSHLPHCSTLAQDPSTWSQATFFLAPLLPFLNSTSSTTDQRLFKDIWS